MSTIRESPSGRRINHLLNVGAAMLLAILAAFYIADSVQIRTRPAPLVTLHLPRYLVVPLKGSKTEYLDDGVDNLVCAHSIFPQLGHPPCWYAGRTGEERVNE